MLHLLEKLSWSVRDESKKNFTATITCNVIQIVNVFECINVRIFHKVEDEMFLFNEAKPS